MEGMEGYPNRFCRECQNLEKNPHWERKAGFPRGEQPYGRCHVFSEVGYDDAGIVWTPSQPCLFIAGSEFIATK